MKSSEQRGYPFRRGARERIAVRLFRTLSTPRLVALVTAVAAILVGRIDRRRRPRRRRRDAAARSRSRRRCTTHSTATTPTGVTARIHFTNKLFPSGALTGQAGSALMSGATGRLWANADGGRLELQSDAGDAQIVVEQLEGDGVRRIVEHGVRRVDLPQEPASTQASHVAPTLDEITSFLDEGGRALGDLRCEAVERRGAGGLHRSRSRRSTTAGCSAPRSSPGMPSTARRCESRSTRRAPRARCSRSRRPTSRSGRCRPRTSTSRRRQARRSSTSRPSARARAARTRRR